METIGLDIAKRVFQAHGADASGKAVLRRKLQRAEVLTFFAAMPPCLVGIEACSTAHHWAREITALGHQVRLIPASYVKPYVKRGKTDAADAEAICEAVTRPTMRFVPIKSAEQQAVLMLHRTRDLLVRQRTMLVNALRGHMAEMGIIAPQGISRVADLVAALLGEDDTKLPRLARYALRGLAAELEALGERGDCQNFRVWVRFTNQACALVKRSRKRMANWAFAMFHSRGGMIHSFSALCNTRNSSLMAASSLGKWPRARTARRSLALSASMEFVV